MPHTTLRYLATMIPITLHAPPALLLEVTHSGKIPDKVPFLKHI
jgi:hypothetical protein